LIRTPQALINERELSTFCFSLLWVAIALLMAGVVWCWTGGFSAALVALLLVGVRLRGLSKAVGHPQLWIILAVAVLLWLGLDWVSLPSRSVRAFWVGVVLYSFQPCPNVPKRCLPVADFARA